jgi:hypothetical protein
MAAQLMTQRCRLENILDHSKPIVGFIHDDQRQTLVTWDATGEAGIWELGWPVENVIF